MLKPRKKVFSKNSSFKLLLSIDDTIIRNQYAVTPGGDGHPNGGGIE